MVQMLSELTLWAQMLSELMLWAQKLSAARFAVQKVPKLLVPKIVAQMSSAQVLAAGMSAHWRVELSLAAVQQRVAACSGIASGQQQPVPGSATGAKSGCWQMASLCFANSMPCFRCCGP